MVTGEPSRLAWALSSLLFFIVPGWVVLKRERDAEKVRAGEADAASDSAPSSDGDAVQLEGISEESDHGGR